MKVYFLSGFFPDEEYHKILKDSKTNVQNAADVLQKKYLTGFCELSQEKKVSVINLPYIGPYPKHYSKVFFKPIKKTLLTDKTELKNISFCNIEIIKNIDRVIKSLYYSYKCISNDKKNKNYTSEEYFFIYSMHLPFLLSGVLLKKKFKKIKFIVIVPDLPEYMSERKGASKYIYNFFGSISYYLVNQLDGVVVITEPMKEKFSNQLKKVVIEGIASVSDFKETYSVEENESFFMYSGGLNKRYGITNLIESFVNSKLVDTSLYICGDGPDKDIVIDAAKKYENIRYLGLLERKQVLELQQKATLLINPRKNIGEFVKYSFPSKVLEYMSSGTPLLMYKLDGIPDEYYDYVYALDDSSQSLTDSLISIHNMEKSQLVEFGLKAKDFVQNKKNPASQIRKIFN